jgi:serine/threonine-protein kinase HipA
VLSVQNAVDHEQINQRSFRLAMSAGTRRHYRVGDVLGRHFVQTAKSAGMGPTIIVKVLEDILEKMGSAAEHASNALPDDFARDIHDSVAQAMAGRRKQLETALIELA